MLRRPAGDGNGTPHSRRLEASYNRVDTIAWKRRAAPRGGLAVSGTLWVLVVLAVVFMVGAGMLARALVMDVARSVRVADVLKDHDAELRSVPGVQSLGTHSGSGESAHIVVYVDKVTPALRAAIPATLDGYRVDIEAQAVLPPSPPKLVGEVDDVIAATPTQAAAGIVGVLTIEGDLYKVGDGMSQPSPCALLVRVPSTVQIWRPQGEGKEFITFTEVRVGDTVAATLTAAPGTKARSATAADIEVYGRR
jgi:hypothetical protein